MSFFTRNKTLWTVIGLLVLINLGWLAFMIVKERRHHPHLRRHMVERHLERRLDLNNDQKERFEGLRAKHFEEIRAYRQEMRELRKELFENLKQGNALSEVTDKIEAIGDLHIEIEKENYKHFQSLRSEISEEQRTDFDRMLGRMMRHMEERGFGRHY